MKNYLSSSPIPEENSTKSLPERSRRGPSATLIKIATTPKAQNRHSNQQAAALLSSSSFSDTDTDDDEDEDCGDEKHPT
jgi:hypothetical protein